MAKEKNRDVNVHREWAKLWMGVLLVLFGMGIIAYSIVVEPQGVVDYSVVTAFGGVLTWAGAMFGIDSHSKIRIHEQDMEFESKRYEQDKFFEAKKLELENEMARLRMERQRGPDIEKDEG